MRPYHSGPEGGSSRRRAGRLPGSPSVWTLPGTPRGERRGLGGRLRVAATEPTLSRCGPLSPPTAPAPALVCSLEDRRQSWVLVFPSWAQTPTRPRTGLVGVRALADATISSHGSRGSSRLLVSKTPEAPPRPILGPDGARLWGFGGWVLGASGQDPRGLSTRKGTLIWVAWTWEEANNRGR